MQLSDNGRKLIQSFEGLSLKAYPDAAGYSIGYGHYGVKPGDTITREEADRLFKQDVIKYEAGVSYAIPQATQQQFDAMVSLAYNIGTGGFAKSTVAARHNLGDYAGAADAFRMWNKSQGKELPVLTKRREKELEVYLYGYGAYPMNTSNESGLSASTNSEPTKGGLGQFLLGIAIAGGLLFGVYTRTNLLQGRFSLRTSPRPLPGISQ